MKKNLINLLDRTNDTESEEFHKNLVTNFFKKTYYEPTSLINSKSDTTSLEAGIEQLVYRLYGLTEEEIAVVGSS